MELFYYANDNLVEMSGLLNTATGAYINDASVSVTLKDSAGVDLPGVTWPLVMGYAAGSNGIYRATVPTTVTVAVGQVITAEVDATGDLLTGHWTVAARVISRGFDL